MPIEEWLFFLVVPVCALLTYEVVGCVTRRFRRTGPGQPGDRRGQGTGEQR
jgi:hypothetical protein